MDPLHIMSIFQNSANCQHSRGYPGSVRGWKNGLRGLFDPVRLGQVRIAIKSSIIEPLGPPIHSLACFGRKFERTVFERTTSSLSVWSFWISSTGSKSLPTQTSQKVATHFSNLIWIELDPKGFIPIQLVRRCNKK